MPRKTRLILFGIPFILLVIALLFSSKTPPLKLKIALNGTHGIYRAETNRKIVSLTFDDGPDPRFTLPILDTLKEYQAPATFFMVGNNVKTYPDIAQRIVAEGHEVGNHTMSHPTLPNLDPTETYQEISSCYHTIHDITGVLPHYFRSPKGLTTDSVEKSLPNFELQEIFWTVTIENRDSPTPEEMVSRVLQKVQPGYIILLHDGRLDRSKTVQALPLLLKELKRQGYQVVPLSDLLQDQDDTEIVAMGAPST